MENLNNIHVVEEPSKYIGFNLFTYGKCNSNDSYVQNKMKDKLHSWKAKILSFAGKVTLIKHVMSSIASYLMQVMRFPTYVCEEMDKVNQNFL